MRFQREPRKPRTEAENATRRVITYFKKDVVITTSSTNPEITRAKNRLSQCRADVKLPNVLRNAASRLKVTEEEVKSNINTKRIKLGRFKRDTTHTVMFYAIHGNKTYGPFRERVTALQIARKGPSKMAMKKLVAER